MNGRIQQAIQYRGRRMYARSLGPMLSPFRKAAVVVFHIGRSGSSVLADQLHQDVRFYWDGEVYGNHLRRLGIDERSFNPEQLVGAPTLEPRRLARQSGPMVYGCEIKFFHLRLFGIDLSDFVAQLAPSGFTHAIVLERRNHLAKIASSVRAHQDGTYHHQANSAPRPAQPVHLNRTVSIDFESTDLVQMLASYRDDYSVVRELLQMADLPTLDLSYEQDIEADPKLAYEKVCDFLAMTPHNIEPRLQKLRPRGDLGIENLAEVRGWLDGTGFDWMCD